MRMRLWFLLLILGAVACATWPKSPLTVTLYAQTLPVTKTLAWDAGLFADSYIVTLDAAQIGTPTGTTQSATFTTAGSHTWTVRSVNLWGQSTAASQTVNVVLPGTPANLRLQ